MGVEPGHPRVWKLFELPFRPWLARQLAGIHLEGLPHPPDPALPLVLVANHCSWFDGFLLREIQRRVRPGDVFRTVMLDRELRDRPLLRALGGTGFDPERPSSFRGVLRELQTVRDRTVARRAGTRGRRTGGLSVAFFPQGRIRPAWENPLDFRPGLRLLLRALEPVVVLPVGLHLEMGNQLRPHAFVSVGSALDAGASPAPEAGLSPAHGARREGWRGDEDGSRTHQPASASREPEDGGGERTQVPDALEAAVTARLERIRSHLRRHGESAPSAWPPPASPEPRSSRPS